MNTSKNVTVKKDLPQEPYRFTKRLGSAVYEVEVRFNPDAKETMNDKKLRLIRHYLGSRETQFRGKRTSDGAVELSRLRGSERSEVREDAEAVS